MGVQAKNLNMALSALKESQRVIKEEIFKALAKLGEECVAKVRDRSQEESWFDQTGNLRSSIGYAIYDHGIEQIKSSFSVVKNGGQGASEGRKALENLAREYSRVYALVVVAGMNYAQFVEARDNKDVLASTELWARSVCDGKLKLAVKEAIRRINAIKR